MEFLQKELINIKNNVINAEKSFFINYCDHFNVGMSEEDFSEHLEENIYSSDNKDLINLYEEVKLSKRWY